MGGFECSTHRLARHAHLGALMGKRIDVIRDSRHDEFARQDYERLRGMGMTTARDGARWHLIEKSPHRYDFESLLPMLGAARDTGTQVIWDLFHYGWPDDLDIWSDAFVERFAQFAQAAARVIYEESGEAFLAPVNEISFVSWGGGDVAYLNPFARGRGPELKVQLVRAAIAAMQAIRAVVPQARFCHIDPIIHIAAFPDQPEEAAPAEMYRRSMFEAWDMIAGRLHPELGGREEWLDIIGVNYYSNNQWVHQDHRRPEHERRPHTFLPPSHPLHRPIREILLEIYERYERPIFIGETGIEDDARPSWLRYVAQEARGALRMDVPLHGLCLYPVVNHPGWDDDRHCSNGLWDYADAAGHRAVYQPLRDELKHQQALQEAQNRGQIVPDEAINWSHLDGGAQQTDARTQAARTNLVA